MTKTTQRIFALILAIALRMPLSASAELPDAFDLRNVEGNGHVNHTTPIRHQAWGTCWIHATLASMESNLLLTDHWRDADMGGTPDLAEYHMDKFNGFNRQGQEDDEVPGWFSGQGEPFPGSNTDEPLASRWHGLIVHLGGDYRAAAAYLTNHGAVNETSRTFIPHDLPGGYPAMRARFGYLDNQGILRTDRYTFFIPHDIEWLTLDPDLTPEQKRRRIKQAILAHGAVATCENAGGRMPGRHADTGYHVYRYTGSEDLNHANAIIGWDDHFTHGDYEGGAWLIKDSSHFGGEYLWRTYDDRWTARHALMGGVQFRSVNRRRYDMIHSHSLHGWQYDTAARPHDFSAVANRFIADERQLLLAVGVYTLADNAQCQIRVLNRLNASGAIVLASAERIFPRPGFHLVELDHPTLIDQGDAFAVSVELDRGGYAFDASFRMHVAMGAITAPPYDVFSAAESGQSFYRDSDGLWRDFILYDAYARLDTRWADHSWNFAINAYAVAVSDHAPLDRPTTTDLVMHQRNDAGPKVAPDQAATPSSAQRSW